MNILFSLFSRISVSENMGCQTLLLIRRFCCCCTLRTGSFIIGYLGLMSYCIQVVAGSVQLSSYRDHYFLTYSNNTSNSGHVYMLYSKYASVIIAYNISLALACASMLWGVHKTKSEFILPWLILNAANLCLSLLIILAATISFLVVAGIANGGFFIILAIFVVFIWLAMYTYACVFSYYKEIKSKEETDKEDNVPPPYITYQEEKKEVL